MQDVRVKRQADVGSDHNLLIAKLSLKLRKARIAYSRNQRFDTNKLKDPKVKQGFSIALRNRFSLLQQDTEMTINSFNKAINEAAKESI